MGETELDQLIKAARAIEVSPSDREQQRRSFAYGNTHFENENITKKTVDEAADQLRGAASGG